jgi:hypothetical protein
LCVIAFYPIIHGFRSKVKIFADLPKQIFSATKHPLTLTHLKSTTTLHNIGEIAMTDCHSIFVHLETVIFQVMIANGDGLVNVVDAIEILKYLSGMTSLISDAGRVVPESKQTAFEAAFVSPEAKSSGRPSIICVLNIIKFSNGMSDNIITEQTGKLGSSVVENLFLVTPKSGQGKMSISNVIISPYIPFLGSAIWNSNDETLFVYGVTTDPEWTPAPNSDIFYSLIPSHNIATTYGTISFKGNIGLAIEGEETQNFPVDFTISNGSPPGHVRGDDKIGIGDVLEILKHLAGIETIQPGTNKWKSAALTNPDTISINDALILLKYLSRGWPIPFIKNYPVV